MAMLAQPRGLPVDGGLGTLRLADDPRWGPVEVLDLIAPLCSVAAERAIRTTIAVHHDCGVGRHDGPIGLVHEVRRLNDELSVVSPVADGVRLMDLLDALETGALTLTDEAIIDVAAAITRAVASMHGRPGALTHGAISPAHVVVGRSGGIVLTDAVYATALQSLAWSRHQWWWQCGLAMPPSAGLPRFDQRADVVQLGGVVLALLLRRRLTVNEYTSLGDLVGEATGRYQRLESGLRAWLQQALNLHARAAFSSGVAAASDLALVLADAAAHPTLRTKTVLRDAVAGVLRR
jgi:hypothetical protein